MKNEVFERDYAEEFRQRQENRPGREFLDALQTCGFFEQYKREMDKIPKRIVPKQKADYEYLLGECDAYVRQFGGKIRGVGDYQKWQSTIDIYLPHVEFCDRESLSLLGEIAKRAENVTFCIQEETLRLSIFISYFDEIY